MQDNLLDDGTNRVYWSRWYIVLIAALLTGTQGGYWNNFGPIAPAVKPLLGIGDGTIALLANYGPIGYFIAIVPSTWVLDTLGLRPATLICLTLVFLGSLIKCFSAQGTNALICIHIGQLLVGLAGPVSMCIGPVVSATWFPPNQRATATSIISVSNYGGCAAMFVLGPWLVKAPASSDSITPAERDQIAHGLLWYMRYETIFCGLLLLMAVVYFPNAPPTPPSRSARAERVDFRRGMTEILKAGNFWYCASAYGMLTGFYGGWGSMLGPNLQQVTKFLTNGVAAAAHTTPAAAAHTTSSDEISDRWLASNLQQVLPMATAQDDAGVGVIVCWHS
jgi:FLVCR family MFS transporter